MFLRGDREINEAKLRNHLQVQELRPASLEETKKLKLVAGFIGPLLSEEELAKILILWDHSVKTGETFVIGANEKDYHYMDYIPNPKIKSYDLALARAGDPVPSRSGKGKLKEMRGIELGHIFKLNQKYSAAFGMKVLNQKGKESIPFMGCYGIGINRALATIIEQHHDEKGICWPISAAPFEILLLSICKSQEELKKAGLFYEALLKAGCETLWDDRDIGPGVKFKDAELIGFPIRVTMGKNYFTSGILEVQLRATAKEEKIEGNIEALVQKVIALKKGLWKSCSPQDTDF